MHVYHFLWSHDVESKVQEGEAGYCKKPTIFHVQPVPLTRRAAAVRLPWPGMRPGPSNTPGRKISSLKSAPIGAWKCNFQDF